MSLDSSAVQFLCAAKNHGVDFTDLLTIGKQDFRPRPDVLARVLRARSVDESEEIGSDEDFYRKALGARTVAAMDYSDYEGASVIHDLNRPIAADLRGRFGVVYDGGSLEHVFYILQAYKSLMEMVRVGGWFAQLTPANNYLGHGFWQMSPELIFRCFTPENGFELHAVLLKENVLDGAWHAARDPAVVGRRVELVNSRRTYLMTLARKTADVEIFATTPQQSDYVAMWDAKIGAAALQVSTNGHPGRTGLKSTVRRLIPSTARTAIRGAMEAIAKERNPASPYESACYTRLEEADVLRGDLGPSPFARP